MKFGGRVKVMGGGEECGKGTRRIERMRQRGRSEKWNVKDKKKNKKL